MNDLREALANLCLDSLPVDFVDNVWSSKFSEEIDLPSEIMIEIGLEEFSEKMNMTILALKHWIKEARKRFHSSPKIDANCNWQMLNEWEINNKSLLSLLSAFIKHDITDVQDGQDILLAITAARLYILFLSIPGAVVFNVFQPVLFDQCMELLKVGNILTTKENKPKKGKSKKHHSSNEEDDLNESGNRLNQEYKNIILEGVCLFLAELSECLGVLKLKGEILALDIAINSLVDVTFLEVNTNVFTTTPQNNTIAYAALKAYTVLEKLCSEEHGPLRETVRTMLRAFSKVLFFRDEAVKISLKEDDSNRRIHIITFILKLIEKNGDFAADSVFALAQQLLIRIPDKADIRGKATTELAQFIEALPPSVIEEYSLWAVSAAFGDKVSLKVAAIELISKLLGYTDKTENKRLHELYFTCILSGALEKSPLVRFKCLNILAANINSNQREVKEIMNNLFINVNDIQDNDDVVETDFFNFNKFFNENMNSEGPIVIPDNILPPGNRIVKMLEFFAIDEERVYVRKSAHLALSNIYLLNEVWINDYRLKLLVVGCKDVSVMIRKQMTKSVTDLLMKYPQHKGITETWVDGIISLLADNDSKSQEKVIEVIYGIIIGNIKPSNIITPESSLPWKLLDLISLKEKRSLFRLACRAWALQKSINEPTFGYIVGHTNSENSYTAWFLIGCLSEYLDYPRPDFIYNYFMENVYLKSNADDSLELLVLESLFLNWRGLKSDVQEDLFSKLKTSVEDFKIPFHLIARSLDILYQIKSNEIKEWCGTLTERCGNYILHLTNPSNLTPINVAVLCQYIFILGEAAMFHPGVKEDVINSVADLIDKNDLSGRIRKTGTDLKAVCVVTLSKLCLQDHFLAKKYVPVLAMILNNISSTVNVKINTLAGLADLCVRFTSVVEDYLGDMCIALKDKNRDVRKTALEHIMQLVMEDYLKLKSPLFYYLLTMLLDPSPQIKELFESFIINSVLKKQPGIMSSFFIQTIFFFNDYEGKGGVDKSQFSQNERILFGLSGINNFNNREIIYKFMLAASQDDQRFKVQNRICIDILDSVCEDKIELNSVGKAVLKDSLNIMACKEMRLEHLHKEEDEHPVEDNLNENLLIDIAKKMLLSHILKKNYVESLVPVVARLKRKLMNLKSTLTRDLMICLREIMKDFKSEINEIFAADPELAAEVAFDLKDIPLENPIIQQFEEAAPEFQEKLSTISQLTLGEDIGNFMNKTIHDLIGSNGRPSTTPASIQQVIDVHENSSSSVRPGNPGSSQSNLPSASPEHSLSTTSSSKLDLAKRSLPIYSGEEETSSSLSSVVSKSHVSDISTEYSSSAPVSTTSSEKVSVASPKSNSETSWSSPSDVSHSSIPSSPKKHSMKDKKSTGQKRRKQK